MKNILTTSSSMIGAAIAGAFGDNKTQPNIVAAPNAAPIVYTFVDRVNTHINTPAIRYDPQGFGTDLRLAREAKARLASAKHRKKIDAIFAARPMTRQQFRAERRREDKLRRSQMKANAAKNKNFGGSASIA